MREKRSKCKKKRKDNPNKVTREIIIKTANILKKNFKNILLFQKHLCIPTKTQRNQKNILHKTFSLQSFKNS